MLEGGSWVIANGTSPWSVELDLSGMPEGPRNITVRAYDGKGYSDPDTLQIVVKRTHAPSRGFLPGFGAAPALLAAALALAGLQLVVKRLGRWGKPGPPGL